MAKAKYKIPFNQKGEMITYESGGTYYNYKTQKHEPVIWEDVSVFKDTVEYAGYDVGRSACRILLKSVVTKRQYSVLISDYDRLMKEVGLIDNAITADFTFAKRGSNYMMVPVLPDIST